MKVSLVRHTSVELDGNFTCYGALDVEVNPTFEQEAKGAKERIEGRWGLYKSSPESCKAGYLLWIWPC